MIETGGSDGHATQGIGPVEFSAFQKLIRDEAGIHLSDAKRPLLVSRLTRRLRELSLTSFGAYLDRVRRDPAERVQMLDCICTNETHFFREPAHFQLLERSVLPRWRALAAEGKRQKRVRVWSAGCSTGEEPFSIAMTLLEQCSGWQLEVVGTDLSTSALDRAASGMWPIARAAEVPPQLLRKYMLRGTRSREGMMKAGPALRRIVSFAQVNLNDATYPLPGRFDLIFCRNVMIYFDGESRREVTGRLLDRLVADGLFFVGHAESLGTVTSRVRPVIPTVYRLAEPA